MKRIVKFRVWDNQQKKYHYNESWIKIALSNQDKTTFGKESIFVLEQFINCYDKNGKEIYEGDVVNGLSYNGSYRHGKIIYYKNSFLAVPLVSFCDGFSESFEQCEVIGNIHEKIENYVN